MPYAVNHTAHEYFVAPTIQFLEDCREHLTGEQKRWLPNDDVTYWIERPPNEIIDIYNQIIIENNWFIIEN